MLSRPHGRQEDRQTNKHHYTDPSSHRSRLLHTATGKWQLTMIDVVSPTCHEGQEKNFSIQAAETAFASHLPAPALCDLLYGHQHVVTLYGRDDLVHAPVKTLQSKEQARVYSIVKYSIVYLYPYRPTPVEIKKHKSLFCAMKTTKKTSCVCHTDLQFCSFR